MLCLIIHVQFKPTVESLFRYISCAIHCAYTWYLFLSAGTNAPTCNWGVDISQYFLCTTWDEYEMENIAPSLCKRPVAFVAMRVQPCYSGINSPYIPSVCSLHHMGKENIQSSEYKCCHCSSLTLHFRIHHGHPHVTRHEGTQEAGSCPPSDLDLLQSAISLTWVWMIRSFIPTLSWMSVETLRIPLYDFFSAFKTIQPLLLIEKLLMMGVSMSTVSWIADYL